MCQLVLSRPVVCTRKSWGVITRHQASTMRQILMWHSPVAPVAAGWSFGLFDSLDELSHDMSTSFDVKTAKKMEDGTWSIYIPP